VRFHHPRRLGNKAIAKRLKVAERTAAFHVSNVLNVCHRVGKGGGVGGA